MNEDQDYSKSYIDERVNNAIQQLFDQDSFLLDQTIDINERSVTHRLAMYLANEFPEEDVDCEYNRTYDPIIKEYVAKRMNLPKVDSGVTLEDTEAKTVYPDIIVHRRGTTRNLLALEVKMGWKNSKGDFDIIKAQAYRDCLNYRYSIYLEIGPGKKHHTTWV